MVNDDSSPDDEALTPVDLGNSGAYTDVDQTSSETSKENYEEDSEDERAFSRRETTKFGIGALIGLGGLGGLFALSSYRGGDAESSPELVEANTSLNESGRNMFNPTREDVDTEPIDFDESNPDPGDEPSLDGNIYFLEGSVEVDLDSLDPIMSSSAVTLGVQENGNLIAYNEEVETDGGYNPLWRFRADTFPDPNFYDVGSQHPLEELYQEINRGTEEMTEDMVNVFYNEDIDDGTWEDHSEYMAVNFSELKDGLIEYGGLGEAQDYFFDRAASLNENEAVLESEWRELLQDGLEAENGY